MHHFIFPIADTYITNRPPGLDAKNFGVDEILQVGTDNSTIEYTSPTTDYTYSNVLFSHNGLQDFTGRFTGSVIGTSESSSATLSGSVIGFFTSSFDVENFTGSITNGQLICLYGSGSGVDSRQQKSHQVAVSSYKDRALLHFDLTAISQSISDGTIVSASFHLKVKICNEYQLPIEYTIYTAPIGESWLMGKGYASDGGSDNGASWIYRDYNGGTPWAITGSTYALPFCSQSFRYKSADLDMDVTPIVEQWLSGAPNYGFVVISSDEFYSTGSGFLLKYFSEDTNTIYSPLLDVAWDDFSFVTGSVFTSSVNVSIVTGSSVVINNSGSNSGSWIIGRSGVHGNFTASTALNIGSHYIVSSGDMTYYCDHFVQQFTGSLTGSFSNGAQVSDGTFSGSGEFYTDYFTGSIDGFVFETVNQYISGTYISGSISGSVFMPPSSSIELFTGHLMSPAIVLNGTGSGRYYDSSSYAFEGFIMGRGISGNIAGVPIFGPAFGVINATTTVVTLPTEWHYSHATSPNESPYGNIVRQIFNCGPYCGHTPCNQPGNPWDWPGNPNMGPHGIHPYPACNDSPYAYDSLYYIWGGDDVGWRTTLPAASSSVVTSSCGKFHTVQLMTGTFSDGVFSGSSFFAFYENYRISFGVLTGSWNPIALDNENFIISFPAIYDNYYTAYLYGPYVYGPLLGVYTTYSSYSASFHGQFTDGLLLGGTVDLQLSGLSGSVYTSSFYSSSVSITSSSLSPLDVERPFSINISNLQPEYKAGDIIKIGVFGRKKFPLKYFGISTQQEQYLYPEFLPSSSYWALKDNQTDEIVVNFDSFTQISCAYPEGNYFFVDTTSLPQERYYRVLIRVEDGSIIDTIDTGKTFKITR